jgi:hypothetical protein
MGEAVKTALIEYYGKINLDRSKSNGTPKE